MPCLVNWFTLLVRKLEVAYCGIGSDSECGEQKMEQKQEQEVGNQLDICLSNAHFCLGSGDCCLDSVNLCLNIFYFCHNSFEGLESPYFHHCFTPSDLSP